MRLARVAGCLTIAAASFLAFAEATPAEATPAAAALSAAPPSGVSVDVLNVNGSGCRPGTTAVSMSPDREAFTVTYSTYLAQAGGGTSAKEATKDCRLNLKVNSAAGYSPGIGQVDYRGFADLAVGATAGQEASYRFHGDSRVAATPLRLAGPFQDSWQFTNTPGGGPVFGTCGKSRLLDIDTALNVSAGGSGADTPVSYITMDSADGVAVATYHLVWQRCP